MPLSRATFTRKIVAVAYCLLSQCRSWWCVVSFILGIDLVLTVPVTKAAEVHRAARVPFALASISSNTLGGGQGLSLGLLNLPIVIPQIIVSMLSGVNENALEGGNLPALISAIMALLVLPNTTSMESIDLMAGGGH